MSDNPWIPVEEMLPEPGRVVWAWTNYDPCKWFKDEVEGRGPRRANYSYTLMAGYLDEQGDWWFPVIGNLTAFNSTCEIFKPFHVEFWMLMPPAPPGREYPKLKHFVTPNGRGK